MLTVIYEITPECVAIMIERKLNSERVLDCLPELFVMHGSPDHVCSDNGLEFTAKSVSAWLDNVFKERLWWSVKFEGIYFKADATARELKTGINRYFLFYNSQ